MATDDDGGPFFRAYALKAGDVLTEQDAADIQTVLADYNDEIAKAAAQAAAAGTSKVA